MKAKYKKIIACSLAAAVIAAVSAYTWLPGTKTVANQGVKATKAAAAHYLSTEAVDASNIRQVITADSTTSRTFMWQSDYAEDKPVIEYRKAGDDDTLMQLPASSDAFSDDGVTTYIHTATVTGLEPGTAYEYRVGAGDKRSSWQPFHTAQGSDFKALIFPDSQSSDYSVWAATAQPAWQRNQDAQFFINMGDLVDNGQDHYQWNTWFDVVSDMIARIPVVPLLGNHETYNKDWKVRMPEAYLHLFALPHIDMENTRTSSIPSITVTSTSSSSTHSPRNWPTSSPASMKTKWPGSKKTWPRRRRNGKSSSCTRTRFNMALPAGQNLVPKAFRRKDSCGCPSSTNMASMPSSRPTSTRTATAVISRTSSAMNRVPCTSSLASPATSSIRACGSSTASMNTLHPSRKRTIT